jgi:hypothetical protein
VISWNAVWTASAARQAESEKDVIVILGFEIGLIVGSLAIGIVALGRAMHRSRRHIVLASQRHLQRNRL